MDTEFAGAVWSDKSVFTDETADLPGVTLDDDNNFLVALSAIASNLSITRHTSAPTDTMLVLDMSGSMVNRTYEVGNIRQSYNNYPAVKGIDMSLISAMIDATNATIENGLKTESGGNVTDSSKQANGGIYNNGVITWNLQLAAGEQKTVSFQVKVAGEGVKIINKATAEEGENKLETNQVTNTTPAPVPSDNPHTGDNTNVALLTTLMLFSIACLFVLVLSRKRETN